VTKFVQGVAAQLPAGAHVLDAGAGECAYKKYFEHCRYTGLDLAVGDAKWNYHNLDVIALLDQMPLASASFDAVLNTQTLEHLSRPQESLRECFRVLKPGGHLFLSAPMAHNEHQTPYDFFRYTSYGLRVLAERAGFTKDAIKIGAFGGMFTRWAYELPHAMNVFPKTGLAEGKPNAKGLLLFPIKALAFGAVRLTQVCLFALDPLDKQRDYPFGWWMIATKGAA
jgi:SAM-dependent methyltransferase